jgi:hypothetical protein
MELAPSADVIRGGSSYALEGRTVRGVEDLSCTIDLSVLWIHQNLPANHILTAGLWRIKGMECPQFVKIQDKSKIMPRAWREFGLEEGLQRVCVNIPK